MTPEEYRELHRSSVTNNSGTSPQEIFIATLTIPVATLLSSLLLPFLLPSRYEKIPYTSRIWIEIFIEFFTIIAPLLLTFTLLSGYVFLLFTALSILAATICIAICVFYCLPREGGSFIKLLNSPASFHNPPYITNYRAGMLLATAISILAVDFKIFPRKFAKTETYGYGLMDVGVGSFVIAMGFVSRGSKWSLKRVVPLLALGLLRLFTVKGLEYNEHVSEYGAHWNFFFTLTLTSIAGPTLTAYARPLVLATASLAFYQTLLAAGLDSWILGETSRANMIAANREGLFSMLGYLTLYWISREIGTRLEQTGNTFKSQLKLLGSLVLFSVLGAVALPTCEDLFGETSRRLANISYCLWMMTFNVGILAGCLGTDLLVITTQFFLDCKAVTELKKPVILFREPYLFRVINYNGLIYFLIANVFTGLVNIVFQPLAMPAQSSLFILVCYCVATTIPVVCLYIWRIRP